ncbi:MAG: NADH-quinone oxidoreductase subunit A [Thermoprotei archaeon]|nr:NADH-quinone oxidoreductase subunit A [Thermoprotei archaeon]
MIQLMILASLTVPLIVICLLYLISALSSPKPRKSADRDAPYACGEYFPPVRPQVTINLFWFATVFLVFDIIDFIIALSYGIELISPLLPLAYLALAILALIIAIRWR